MFGPKSLADVQYLILLCSSKCFMEKKSAMPPIDQLRDIHRLMERTSKFIGLSGLSGVGAGVFALLGAVVAYLYLRASNTNAYGSGLSYEAGTAHPWGWAPVPFLLATAALVLLGALGSGVYFTTRRTRRKGQAIWDALTRRLLVNLAIPLAAGGVFCAALLYHGLPGLLAPTTLVFYGLALINGSKFTLDELRYLGLLEVVLGCAGLFLIGWGLLLWTVGFGVLHIVYGTLMYLRYERGQ